MAGGFKIDDESFQNGLFPAFLLAIRRDRRGESHDFISGQCLASPYLSRGCPLLGNYFASLFPTTTESEGVDPVEGP